jgi:dihydropteroate synthase
LSAEAGVAAVRVHDVARTTEALRVRHSWWGGDA